MTPRIIFFSVNGVGLGHLMRTLTVAECVRSARPETEIRIVTSAVWTDPIVERHFDFLQIERGEFLITVGAAGQFLKLVDEFVPDIIVWDTYFPVPVLERVVERGIGNVLVLRKKTTAAFADLLSWESTKKMSKILLPHSRSEFNKEEEALLKDYAHEFVGPIVRPLDAGAYPQLRSKYQLVPDDFVVVFSCGGGGRDENNPGADQFLQAVGAIEGSLIEQGLKPLVVTGPLAKQDLSLRNRVEFEPHLPELIALANLCVATAGYNICNEILLARTPAILVPLERHQESQRERIEQFVKMGIACAVEEASADELRRAIFNFYDNRDLLARIARENSEKLSVDIGNARAATAILDFCEKRRKANTLSP